MRFEQSSSFRSVLHAENAKWRESSHARVKLIINSWFEHFTKGIFGESEVAGEVFAYAQEHSLANHLSSGYRLMADADRQLIAIHQAHHSRHFHHSDTRWHMRTISDGHCAILNWLCDSQTILNSLGTECSSNHSSRMHRRLWSCKNFLLKSRHFYDWKLKQVKIFRRRNSFARLPRSSDEDARGSVKQISIKLDDSRSHLEGCLPLRWPNELTYTENEMIFVRIGRPWIHPQAQQAYCLQEAC